jgi:hypothetical protein
MASQNTTIQNTIIQNTPIQISRTASAIGGVALLLIAIVAGVSNFAALLPLITSGDAVATTRDIGGAVTQFRLGVLGMNVAAVLDIVVAAALLKLLEPVNRMVAVTAAWFRIAYSAVFLVAIAQLASVPALLDQPEAAMNAVDAYTVTWRIGLILFGAHLLLVGYLGFRSRFMPRVIAVLVAIAGLGYIWDGVGTILLADSAVLISTYTFVGEVALIGWLLFRAIRGSTARQR